MTAPIFDHVPSKISEITFSFPEFGSACKKSVHSIYSFLRYNQFYSPLARLVTPISGYARLLIYVNLCRHATNQAISLIYSGDMVN